MAQWVKTVTSMQGMQETWAWPLGQEDLLKEVMAIHSIILAWRIPWKEEPGGLQSIRLQRVRHSWSYWARTHAHSEYSQESGCIHLPYSLGKHQWCKVDGAWMEESWAKLGDTKAISFVKNWEYLFCLNFCACSFRGPISGRQKDFICWHNSLHFKKYF